jgi:hypothetical protein
MKTPEIRVYGRVTASNPTAITITPGPDSMDDTAGARLTSIVVNGAGVDNWKALVGEVVAVKITSA